MNYRYVMGLLLWHFDSSGRFGMDVGLHSAAAGQIHQWSPDMVSADGMMSR